MLYLVLIILAVIIFFFPFLEKAYYGQENFMKRKARLLHTWYIENIKLKGDIMAITLSPYQFIEGKLGFVDRKGRPAKVQYGSVEYSSSDESVFVVEEDFNDESKFKIVAKGEGVAQLNYSADADLDDGVKTISGFVAIEILPEEAVGFGLPTFGEPQDQEEAESTTSTTTDGSTEDTTTVGEQPSDDATDEGEAENSPE